MPKKKQLIERGNLGALFLGLGFFLWADSSQGQIHNLNQNSSPSRVENQIQSASQVENQIQSQPQAETLGDYKAFADYFMEGTYVLQGGENGLNFSATWDLRAKEYLFMTFVGSFRGGEPQYRQCYSKNFYFSKVVRNSQSQGLDFHVEDIFCLTAGVENGDRYRLKVYFHFEPEVPVASGAHLRAIEDLRRGQDLQIQFELSWAGGKGADQWVREREFSLQLREEYF